MGTLQKCLVRGMLGDLRGIFLTAESAPSAARFRPNRILIFVLAVNWGGRVKFKTRINRII